MTKITDITFHDLSPQERAQLAAARANEYAMLLDIAVQKNSDLVELIRRAHGIRHPNSGTWTKKEKERSWAAWDEEAKKVLEAADRKFIVG